MMTTNKHIVERKRSNKQCYAVARWVKGGNIALMRALSHSSYDSLEKLEQVRVLLNKTYHLDLTASPRFEPKEIVKNVKQFCGELLDRCSPNHWKTIIRQSHACLITRVSVASSLFSLRKLLASSKPDVRAYAERMSTPQDDLNPDFAIFCSQELGRLFKQGWDRGYWSQVESFTPPTKSNRDKKTMGTYRDQATEGVIPRDDFLRWAGGTVVTPLDREVKAKAVQTGGKWRVITLSEPRLANLLPLHRTIYNFLTKEKWLLRGEAKPERFEDFGRIKGEVFVSGDYESATDNLNINLSELILRRLLSTATHIPLRVREEAMASLRLRFRCGKTLLEHQRGQLMGSPLSFPLLCLSNYLTFRYAVRRDVPCRINGDDIVFRATPSEVDDWFRLVKESGLVVSPGKTLVHSRFFSLNSTYFSARDSGVGLIPHFRMSCLGRRCEDMMEMKGRVAQIKRDLAAGEIRCIALRTLMRANLSMIYSSQGSVSRRFGMPIPGAVLRSLGLADRESFYRGFISEPEPLERYREWTQAVVPKEWKKTRTCFRDEYRVSDDEIVKTFVSRSWTEPIISQSKDEFYKRLRDGSYRYVPFAKKTYRLYQKAFRGMEAFVKQIGKSFVPSVPAPYFKEEKFWVAKKECDKAARSFVAFVPGGRVK